MFTRQRMRSNGCATPILCDARPTSSGDDETLPTRAHDARGDSMSHPPTMNTLTATLARATLRGSAFPAKLKCVDYPLVPTFYVDAAPSDDDLRAFIRTLEEFPQFRSRAVPANGRSAKTLKSLRWALDDADDAMSRVTRVEVASAREMREVMDRETLRPFDVNAPLWDCVVVTMKAGATWDEDDARFPAPPAVMLRVSHAIGDGISLVEVLKKVTTSLNGGELKMLDFQRRAPAAHASVLAAIWSVLTFLFLCVYGTLKALLTAAGPYDTYSTFKGVKAPYAFTGKRQIVVCPPVSMEDLKAVKSASGCTVNDVVVSALAGAIQKYHIKMGDKQGDRKPFIRAACPYAFPGRAQAVLTNSWTFVSLTLPMGVMSVADRLKKAHKVCNTMKRSPEPYVTRALNEIVNIAGPNVQRQIVCDYMTRHSMVFTNVPGPTEPILLFGKRVRDIVFACANIINQVSVLSYAGHLRLTLVVDSDVTPDAEYIGQMFSEEIAALKAVYS